MRGIALSAPATEREQPNFEMLKPWAATVLEMLLDVPDLPLVNVNFPAKPPRGTLWTCQSMRHYDGKVVPAKDPMGRLHYWYTVVPVEATEEGTDRWAMDQGYVSMTPLRLDLTDQDALERVRKLEAWQKLKFADSHRAFQAVLRAVARLFYPEGLARGASSNLRASPSTCWRPSARVCAALLGTLVVRSLPVDSTVR